jgi:hypothetical protein
MDDTMLLERRELEEALVAPPAAVDLPSAEGWPPTDEVRTKADEAIRKSKEWLHSLTQKIARARRHKDHRKFFGSIWPQLEPSWTRAIQTREDIVRRMDAMLAELGDSEMGSDPELRRILQRVNVHVVGEHRTLVQMYYMLKADADNSAEDTRGHGKPLSSTEDLRAYFKRIRAA